MQPIYQVWIYYLLIINIITFVVWGIDKRKAIKKKWRIKEKTLLILTALGGFIGAFLWMNLFRHKTVKSKFLYYFRGLIFIWLVILITLLFI